MQSIAILTPDIMGPIANGGIGTAFYYLARLLSQTAKVTIVLVPENQISTVELQKWQKYYQHLGIELAVPTFPDPANPVDLICTPEAKRSYSTYLYLKSRHFDVVHFPDYLGLPFYALNAKKSGLAFQTTSFVGHLHGNTAWHLEGSHLAAFQQMHFEREFLESESIRRCDVVVSPSQYMLNWARQKGWIENQPAFVIPHAPIPDIAEKTPAPLSDIQAVAFIGRLEDRKGIRQFLDACRYLPKNLKIKIIGKHGDIQGQSSTTYLANYCAKENLLVDIRTDATHLEILEILLQRNCLAVIPSLLENLPCIIFECLATGTPVLWTDRGGTYELFQNGRDDGFQIQCTAESIARTIQKFFAGELTRPQTLSLAARNSSQTWLQLHQDLAEMQRKKTKATDFLKDGISIIIPTKNRPGYLFKCLESFHRQTYKNFEVIIADDDSAPEAQNHNRNIAHLFGSQMDISYRFGSFGGPGCARNQAVQQAKHQLLFFFDDDNLADENLLENLLKAKLRTGADIITMPYEIRYADRPDHPRKTIWVPLGGCLTLAPFSNILGDTAALIDKQRFLAIGGFNPDLEKDEDWDFHWRAIRHGEKIFVLPDELFTYSIHGENRSLVPKSQQAFPAPTHQFIHELPQDIKPFIQAFIWDYRQRQTDLSKPLPSLAEAPWKQAFKIENPQITGNRDCHHLEFSEAIYIHAHAGDPYLLFQSKGQNSKKAFLYFQILCQRAGQLQIYFRRKNARPFEQSTEFSEKDVIHYPVENGWNEVQLEISEFDPTQFRIDFGSEAGDYILRNIKILCSSDLSGHPLDRWTVIPSGTKLSGQWNPIPVDFQIADMVDLTIRSKPADQGFVQLSSVSEDPQMIFSVGEKREHLFSVFDIAIHVPHETEMQIFAGHSDNGDFEQASVTSINLKPGRNHIQAVCFSSKPVRKWRLDPANQAMDLTIEHLNILDPASPRPLELT